MINNYRRPAFRGFPERQEGSRPGNVLETGEVNPEIFQVSGAMPTGKPTRRLASECRVHIDLQPLSCRSYWLFVGFPEVAGKVSVPPPQNGSDPVGSVRSIPFLPPCCGFLLAFMHPIALALKNGNVGVMRETVEKCGNARSVGKHLVPFLECPVGRNNYGTFFNPVHYLALLERKPGAFDFSRPLEEWALPPCFDLLRRRLESDLEGSKGTLEFIKVLRLLEKASLSQLAKAVEQALFIGATSVDAIKLILEYRRQEPIALFCLDGHPHLKSVRVPEVDLSCYGGLTEGRR